MGALQSQRDMQVIVGNPTDHLVRLTPQLLERIGVELNEIRQCQMRNQFDF